MSAMSIYDFQAQRIDGTDAPLKDYDGKRVVVIGSGATAVTLIPSLAKTAAHVTMLQRSPTYVVARPGRDPLAEWLHGRVPPRISYAVNRWKNWSLQQLMFHVSRRYPQRVKKWMVDQVRAELGEEGADPHFSPNYDPWTQRVCVAPDGDLFEAIRTGAASVVTDQIETFTERGLLLRSGDELEADIVVTATGLQVQFFGGAEMYMDGELVDISSKMTYRSMMLSDVPNVAFTVGYTNASWTLKVDLTCHYVTRLLNHMERRGLLSERDPSVADAPLLNLNWATSPVCSTSSRPPGPRGRGGSAILREERRSGCSGGRRRHAVPLGGGVAGSSAGSSRAAARCASRGRSGSWWGRSVRSPLRSARRGTS